MRVRSLIAALLILTLCVTGTGMAAVPQVGMPVVAAAGEGAPQPDEALTALIDFLVREVLEQMHLWLPPRFADMTADHWARPQVERLAELEVIAGKPGGIYDPEGPVTRAEFLKLLTATLIALDQLPTGQVPPGLSDGFVDLGHWVVTQGWFAGGAATGLVQATDYPGGFGPDESITRAEIARMIIRARAVVSPIHLLPAEAAVGLLQHRFSDTSGLEPGLARFLSAAVLAGYLRGFPDGTAQPGALATRAQAAVLVQRLVSDLQALKESPPQEPVSAGQAFSVWAPILRPDQLPFLLAALEVQTAARAAAEAELRALDDALAEGLPAAALTRAAVYTAQEAEADALERLAFWSGLALHPEAGWAVMRSHWDGTEDGFLDPAFLESPDLFAESVAVLQEQAAQRAGMATQVLLNAAADQEEAAAGLVEVRIVHRDLAARNLLLANQGVAEGNAGLFRQAEFALIDLDCEEIRRLHAELLRQLAALQAALAAAQAAQANAQAQFDAAEQAAKDAEAARDAIQAEADQAQADLQAAAQAHQDLLRNSLFLNGVHFDAPANANGMQYAAFGTGGVNHTEVWFESSAAIDTFLKASESVTQSQKAKDLRQEARDAARRHKAAMARLPAAKAAADAARAAAGAREQALSAAKAQVEALQTQIAVLQGSIDHLEQMYEECLGRRQKVAEAAQAAQDADAALQGPAADAEAALDAARVARQAAGGALHSTTPCPEAERLLSEADELARQAQELYDRARELQRQMKQRYQQAQAQAQEGKDTAGHLQEADQLRRQAEELLRRARELAEQARSKAEAARAAADRCRKTEAERLQEEEAEAKKAEEQGGTRPRPAREVTEEEATSLGDLIDEMNAEQDAQKKAEQAAEIIKRLAEWRASGKTLPGWLGGKVGLGGTAAGSVVGIGLQLIQAGPCPWVAIMVARLRRLMTDAAVEHGVDSAQFKYYYQLWQHYASYYSRNCARKR